MGLEIQMGEVQNNAEITEVGDLILSASLHLTSQHFSDSQNTNSRHKAETRLLVRRAGTEGFTPNNSPFSALSKRQQASQHRSTACIESSLPWKRPHSSMPVTTGKNPSPKQRGTASPALGPLHNTYPAAAPAMGCWRIMKKMKHLKMEPGSASFCLWDFWASFICKCVQKGRRTLFFSAS